MIQRIIQVLLISITIVSCEKPKAYKPRESDTLTPNKIPVVIVNDSDEEEVVDEVNIPSTPGTPDEPIDPIADIPSTPSTPTSPACCKICKSSIPCGDACISSTKTCSKGSGCACNADGVRP